MDVRRFPSELFGDLESHRLGTFGIERPQIDVDEAPGMPFGDLGAEAIDVVVVSADCNHTRSIDLRRGDLASFQTVGNQNECGKTGCCGLGRNRVREIAGGRASHGFEFEFEGLVDGHRRHAILEGKVG